MSAEVSAGDAGAPVASDVRGTLTGDSILSLVAQVAGNSGFFVSVVVLAHALTVAGRGVFAFVTVAAFILARLATVGTNVVATLFTAQRPDERPTLFTTFSLFAVVSGALAGGIAAGALALVPGVRPAGMNWAILLLLPVGASAQALSDVGAGTTLGLRRLAQQAKIYGSVPWLYSLVLAVCWLTVGLTLTAAIGIWVCATLATAVLLLVFSAKGVGLGRPRVRVLLEGIRLGVELWVGSLASFLNFRLDQVLMGFLATESALGVYAVAVNGSEVVLYLPGAVAAVSLPIIARTAPERRLELTLRNFRLLMLVTVPALLVALAAAPLIPIVFGSGYRGAVEPYMLLLPGALGFAATGLFSSALAAGAGAWRSSLGPFVSFAVGLVLDVLLIRPYAANGAAIAATVAFLAGGATATLSFRSRHSFRLAQLVPRGGDARYLVAIVRRLAGALARRRGERT